MSGFLILVLNGPLGGNEILEYSNLSSIFILNPKCLSQDYAHICIPRQH